MADLLVPHHMNLGRTVWKARDAWIVDKLQNGDPTLGWEGDPSLKLVRNVASERWELWRMAPDGKDTLVCTREGERLPGNDLIRALIAADSRRGDRARALIAADDAHRRDVERRLDDQNEELADKLAWALGRDLGIPAQDGRHMPVGGTK